MQARLELVKHHEALWISYALRSCCIVVQADKKTTRHGCNSCKCCAVGELRRRLGLELGYGRAATHCAVRRGLRMAHSLPNTLMYTLCICTHLYTFVHICTHTVSQWKNVSNVSKTRSGPTAPLPLLFGQRYCCVNLRKAHGVSRDS